MGEDVHLTLPLLFLHSYFTLSSLLTLIATLIEKDTIFLGTKLDGKPV